MRVLEKLLHIYYLFLVLLPLSSSSLTMLLLIQLLVALIFTLSIRVDAFSPSSFGVRSSPIRQTSSTSPSTSRLYSSSNNDDVDNDTATKEVISTMGNIYTPLDRPLLAIIDTISLTIFAAIGKSSHSSDGSLDILSVLITAFPFITVWLATAPITAVYSPDYKNEKSNVIASVLMKVMGGWLLAVPLGIVLRGVLKGYVPPTPFIVVTLLATLIILVGVRILFSVAEDFFVEFV